MRFTATLISALAVSILASPLPALDDTSISQVDGVDTNTYPIQDSAPAGEATSFDTQDVQTNGNYDPAMLESNLASNRYISYGALERNKIPCSRRGASASNCKMGQPANPYSRGCSAITRCRGQKMKRWLMDQGLGFVEYL